MMIPILGCESFWVKIGRHFMGHKLWRIFYGAILKLKWGASSRWPSSLYFPKRNRDQMTIGKTRPTSVSPLGVDPTIVEIVLVEILLKVVENLRSWFQAVFSHKMFRVALNSLCKYRPSLTQGQFPGNALSKQSNFFYPKVGLNRFTFGSCARTTVVNMTVFRSILFTMS